MASSVEGELYVVWPAICVVQHMDLLPIAVVVGQVNPQGVDRS